MPVTCDPADVSFRYEGSVVMVTPHSEAAKEWVADNLELEGWQWLGNAFACEPRLAGNLAGCMEGDGLVLSHPFAA